MAASRKGPYLATTWTMPILSAVFWGSCSKGAVGPHADVRAAVCGFCVTLAMLFFGWQVYSWEKGEKT